MAVISVVTNGPHGPIRSDQNLIGKWEAAAVNIINVIMRDDFSDPAEKFRALLRIRDSADFFCERLKTQAFEGKVSPRGKDGR